MLILPIDQHLDEIYKLHLEKPLVLTSSPGSGKTTRVPSFILKKKLKLNNNEKKIIVIVPKRVSALAAAHRVAEENNWNLGEQVGYQVRHDNFTSDKTELIYMTEGLFLKKILTKNFWLKIETLIIDEFHERSSSIDLILGLAFEKLILDKTFNLIIMSATLNSIQLKQFLSDCHCLEINNPVYPIEINYSDKVQKLVCDNTFYLSLKSILLQAWKKSTQDVLIFLPGTSEIIKFKKEIQNLFVTNPIQILTGSISLEDQKKIVQKLDYDKSVRRIILSTNIAESSLTVTGVDCVIDSGLEKVTFTEPKVGFSGLEIQRISKFSSLQRAGRSARLKNGFYYKLWLPIDELSMKDQIEPEIIKSDLIEEILLLVYLGYKNLTEIQNFSWVSPPSLNSIKQSLQKLTDWGIILIQNQNYFLDKDKGLLLEWPLSLKLGLLFDYLIKLGYKKKAARYISILDSGLIDKILTIHKDSNQSDFDLLMTSHLNENIFTQIKKNEKNLLHLSESYNKISENPDLESFKLDVIEAYAHYFPEKIGFYKSNDSGTSLFGRGLKFNSKLLQFEYFLVIAAKEDNGQFTQVIASIEFDKKIAQNLFLKYSKKHEIFFFDFDKQIFYKTEQVKYHSIVIQDFGKTRLSKAEIDLNWKLYFKTNSEQFLILNSDYNKIIQKINFIIRNQKNLFKLNPATENFISSFNKHLTDFILDNFNEFESYSSSELRYLIEIILPADLKDILNHLPDFITNRENRSFEIDYIDEKAPMISVKIQQAFGWADTPCIGPEKNIRLTIALLAPNMRPAQITNQLAHFWKNSYYEIRKELKARYPKHDWPEKV